MLAIDEISRHEPDIVKKLDGEVTLEVSPTERAQPSRLWPVIVHVKIVESSTDADVIRAGKRVGKLAALEEHKIMFESLKKHGTPMKVTQMTEDEMMRAIDIVSELGYDDVVILVNPTVKYDMILKEKLFPAWTQANEEKSAFYAGMLFGHKCYWSPEILDNSFFVIAKGSVGVKWTQPAITFRSTSVGFREDMVCWCIDREGVHVLTKS